MHPVKRVWMAVGFSSLLTGIIISKTNSTLIIWSPALFVFGLTTLIVQLIVFGPAKNFWIKIFSGSSNGIPCPQCGQKNNPDLVQCWKCGFVLKPGISLPMAYPQSDEDKILSDITVGFGFGGIISVGFLEFCIKYFPHVITLLWLAVDLLILNLLLFIFRKLLKLKDSFIVGFFIASIMALILGSFATAGWSGAPLIRTL